MFLKDGTIPESIYTDNVEFKIVQTIIKRQLESVDTDKWNKFVNTFIGFSEETFMGVHHLYTMEKIGIENQN